MHRVYPAKLKLVETPGGWAVQASWERQLEGNYPTSGVGFAPRADCRKQGEAHETSGPSSMALRGEVWRISNRQMQQRRV